MRVAFRTDASIEIGTGHVMRCLTLATELHARGAECVFLCRSHEGQLFDLIAEHGCAVLALEGGGDGGAQAPGSADAPAHAGWLGVAWQKDAADTRAALDGHFASAPVDWLVVDHYGLDARWEQTLRGSCARLMVIDDLADRPHDCDLLLDQSLARIPEDYDGLVPPGATMLLGPQYALLRPEFAQLRAESLTRRAAPVLKRILVTMGGVDKDNVTALVLDALDASALPGDVTVTVVMGAQAPWLDTVRARASRMRLATEVRVGVRDMARLMAESDLTIGAGGTTSWERCALGVPSLTLILARNQEGITATLQEVGAAIGIADSAELGAVFEGLLSGGALADRLRQMSRAAAGVTDGAGAARVAREMEGVGG